MIDFFDNEYAFLSNFYASPIKDINGKIYMTVEHYFQAMKTLDPVEREEIRVAETPGKAKRLGRIVKLRADWEEIKNSVMYEAILQKFTVDPYLKNKLLATGEQALVEGNTWHDNTWGSCTCAKCQDIEGKNELGKILMKVREEIRNATI